MRSQTSFNTIFSPWGRAAQWLWTIYGAYHSIRHAVCCSPRGGWGWLSYSISVPHPGQTLKTTLSIFRNRMHLASSRREAVLRRDATYQVIMDRGMPHDVSCLISLLASESDHWLDKPRREQTALEVARWAEHIEGYHTLTPHLGELIHDLSLLTSNFN